MENQLNILTEKAQRMTMNDATGDMRDPYLELLALSAIQSHSHKVPKSYQAIQQFLIRLKNRNSLTPEKKKLNLSTHYTL